MKPLTLHNRMIPTSSARLRTALLIVVITLMVFGSIIAVLIDASKKEFSFSLATEMLAMILHAMKDKPGAIVELGLLILGTPVYLWYLGRAYLGERLIVDDSGIRYETPLPPVLQFLRPSWTMPWARVRALSFTTLGYRQDIRSMRLVLDAGEQTRKLNPWLWIDRATYTPPTLSSLFKQRIRVSQSREEIRAQLLASPLLTWLADAQPKLFSEIRDTKRYQSYALESNPVAMWVVLLFFALVAYALGDTLLFSEDYIAEPFYAFYIQSGSLATLLCLFILRKAAVPWLETLVVSLLTGAALGCALYPGLLRINQLTDTQGLHDYQYVLEENQRFKPVQSGLPELVINSGEFYWKTFKLGSLHVMRLRKGGLGFYQLDREPLIADYRAHNEKDIKSGSENNLR